MVWVLHEAKFLLGDGDGEREVAALFETCATIDRDTWARLWCAAFDFDLCGMIKNDRSIPKGVRADRCHDDCADFGPNDGAAG